MTEPVSGRFEPGHYLQRCASALVRVCCSCVLPALLCVLKFNVPIGDRPSPIRTGTNGGGNKHSVLLHAFCLYPLCCVLHLRALVCIIVLRFLLCVAFCFINFVVLRCVALGLMVSLFLI